MYCFKSVVGDTRCRATVCIFRVLRLYEGWFQDCFFDGGLISRCASLIEESWHFNELLR